MCPPKDELRGRSSLSEVKSGAIKSILCNWILSPGRTSLRTASAFRAQTRRAHFDSRRAACRIRCVSFRFAQTARKDQGPESLKLGALPLTAARNRQIFLLHDKEKPSLFVPAGSTGREGGGFYDGGQAAFFLWSRMRIRNRVPIIRMMPTGRATKARGTRPAMM